MESQLQDLVSFPDVYGVASGLGSELSGNWPIVSTFPDQGPISMVTIVCIMWSKQLYSVACTFLLRLTLRYKGRNTL